MVNWPIYGLTVPLAVWEQRLGWNSEGLAASRPKPISAPAKATSVVAASRRPLPESRAKARGLAAMSSQMQAFVPREGRESEFPNQAHTTVQQMPQTFDLTADDIRSASSWSLLAQ